MIKINLVNDQGEIKREKLIEGQVKTKYLHGEADVTVNGSNLVIV